MLCTHRVNKVSQQQIIGGFPISKYITCITRTEAYWKWRSKRSFQNPFKDKSVYNCWTKEGEPSVTQWNQTRLMKKKL